MAVMFVMLGVGLTKFCSNGFKPFEQNYVHPTPRALENVDRCQRTTTDKSRGQRLYILVASPERSAKTP